MGTWRSGRVYRFEDVGRWTDVGRLGEELEVMGMLVHNGRLIAGTLPLAEVYEYDGCRILATADPAGPHAGRHLPPGLDHGRSPRAGVLQHPALWSHLLDERRHERHGRPGAIGRLASPVGGQGRRPTAIVRRRPAGRPSPGRLTRPTTT